MRRNKREGCTMLQSDFRGPNVSWWQFLRFGTQYVGDFGGSVVAVFHENLKINKSLNFKPD